jgi:hypothetical protein
VDDRLADLRLPDLTLPLDADWSGRWSQTELLASKTRTRIEGSLEVTASHDGAGVVLDVVDTTPLTQGMSVRSEVAVTCRDDLLLSLRKWVGTAITDTWRGELGHTRAVSGGEARRGEVRFDGLDRSTLAVDDSLPLTTDWGLLAAMPRLHAAHTDRLRFTCLEAVLALRPDQLLEAIDEITLDCASGRVPLRGYRVRGRGRPPAVYWVTEGGVPVIVGSLSKALVLEDFVLLGEGA